MWLREMAVLLAGLLGGIWVTRFLMKPIYCPRCGMYMARRSREMADWLLGRGDRGKERPKKDEKD